MPSTVPANRRFGAAFGGGDAVAMPPWAIVAAKLGGGAAGAAAGAASVGTAEKSAWPQAPQNRVPDSMGALHRGHALDGHCIGPLRITAFGVVATRGRSPRARYDEA
jgi:hypothetical protein